MVDSMQHQLLELKFGKSLHEVPEISQFTSDLSFVGEGIPYGAHECPDTHENRGGVWPILNFLYPK